MNVHASNLIADMGELRVSNPLLGDQRALAEAWERDGYWYFRDVLDKEVIARIRIAYVDYLRELGLVDRDDPQERYNGGDLSVLPVNSNQTKLNDQKAHRLLHEAPTINAFFARLFDCEPFWLPFTVHRTNPPVQKVPASRFDFIHEDGVYNDGLPFLICWVPLDDIDEDVGGVALLEGVHNGPCLHQTEGMNINPIRLEDVPPGTWRRANYRAGDVLLMGIHTPHSGLANISRHKFRLSMDTRIMPSSGKVPYVGKLTQLSSEGVTVEDEKGEHALRFDANSFVRGKQGDQMPLENVPLRYHPGDEVIIAYDGDLIVNMRPQT